MFHFHKFGYFTTKSDHWDNITIWRQCYTCLKSQWWQPIVGIWSSLEHRRLPKEDHK